MWLEVHSFAARFVGFLWGWDVTTAFRVSRLDSFLHLEAKSVGRVALFFRRNLAWSAFFPHVSWFFVWRALYWMKQNCYDGIFCLWLPFHPWCASKQINPVGVGRGPDKLVAKQRMFFWTFLIISFLCSLVESVVAFGQGNHVREKVRMQVEIQVECIFCKRRRWNWEEKTLWCWRWVLCCEGDCIGAMMLAGAVLGRPCEVTRCIKMLQVTGRKWIEAMLGWGTWLSDDGTWWNQGCRVMGLESATTVCVKQNLFCWLHCHWVCCLHSSHFHRCV